MQKQQRFSRRTHTWTTFVTLSTKSPKQNKWPGILILFLRQMASRPKVGFQTNHLTTMCRLRNQNKWRYSEEGLKQRSLEWHGIAKRTHTSSVDSDAIGHVIRGGQPPSNRKLTKRVLLSQVARVCDPLGLAAAFLTRAKIGLQELWQAGVDCHEELLIKNVFNAC